MFCFVGRSVFSASPAELMGGLARVDRVLSGLDLFPKLDNSYRRRTSLGGVLSIVSLTLGLVFACIEVNWWWHPPVRQKFGIISVRPTENDGRVLSAQGDQRLKVRMMLTMPMIPCVYLHLDPLDPVTQHPIPPEHINVKWVRVARDGHVIGALPSDFYAAGGIPDGDCYMGDQFPHHCVTCDDVIRVHRENEVDVGLLEHYAQCGVVVAQMREMDTEGCTVDAAFTMVRMAASFHVAPGMALEQRGWHMHTAVPFGRSMNSFNLTHRGAVSYGDAEFKSFEYLQTTTGHVNVQYWSDVLESDFSIAAHSIYNSSSAIEWRFDLSPIRAVPYLDQEPLLRLLTRLCCVIGGTIGIARLLDFLVFKVQRRSEGRRMEG